ncbi:hypothetical protein HAT2_00661 [Candidatus Similichlamydia laticola]|uniref:Uncharacterized protein n=1 Tax=Candidatus Similichlamydia laticola TaxID=2170265 RepID=A0A369K9B9_9BACT|nr:hypothetical protein HAT2_00661 [Candidatus Similichlamydia laticola]
MSYQMSHDQKEAASKSRPLSESYDISLLSLSAERFVC